MSQKFHYLKKKKCAQYKAYLIISFITKKKKTCKIYVSFEPIDLVANRNHLFLTTLRERHFKNKLENLARLYRDLN